MQKMGIDAAPLSPEQFAKFVQAEQVKYAALVKRSGAQID
jgi:tripartite-type tricarboxylate transporter receptor subunit TctC